jgi:sporulation protein YlmC with PRC-barrel domain
MLSQDQIDQVQGSDVYGADGDKIGSASEVYLDDQTGQPAWVTVNTGLFGTSESFIPLTDASFSGDRLTVPYDKDKVKGAPNVSEDGHITPEEEQALYEYYGMTSSSGYTEHRKPRVS